MLVGALLAGVCEMASAAVPRRIAADADTLSRGAFDAQRAWAHLERQVAFGPRVPGTEAHRRQLEWMLNFLESRADTVMEQRFTHRPAGAPPLALSNVIARFRPELRDRLLLVAHWDTRPRADASSDPEDRELAVPGANDGASGVAVLLELAEVMAEHPPPIGVDLLFTDGEDLGPTSRDMFLGARHYAVHPLPGPSPMYGVLLDMVGDRDPQFPVEGYSARYAPEAVQRVWGIARELGYAPLFPSRVGESISDDHVPLNQAGIPTASIIDFEYGAGNRFWHTPLDVPENTSAKTLGIVGAVLTELVYRGG